jgi:hypothetical protein
MDDNSMERLSASNETLPSEVDGQIGFIDRRSFLKGVATGALAFATGVYVTLEVFDRIDGNVTADATPSTDVLSSPEVANTLVSTELSERYDLSLREKAEKRYEFGELLEFATSTKWLSDTSFNQVCAELGVELHPSSFEATDMSQRETVRENFRQVLASYGIEAHFDFDPDTDQALFDTDPDLTPDVLARRYYDIARTLASFPAGYLQHMKHFFSKEDRAIVAETNDTSEYDRTKDSYLYVLFRPGSPYDNSITANIRGMATESSQFDMMHEGCHTLQTAQDNAEFFTSVKETQPELSEMLVWFNIYGESLPDALLVKELLENAQGRSVEDLAGTMTSTLRRGFIAIPEGVDSQTKAYLEHLLDKQVAATEWASRKSGVDMFAFIEFKRRFGNIHPSAVVRAAESGLFEGLSPYDATFSGELANSAGLYQRSDLNGLLRINLQTNEGEAQSFLAFYPDESSLLQLAVNMHGGDASETEIYDELMPSRALLAFMDQHQSAVFGEFPMGDRFGNQIGKVFDVDQVVVRPEIIEGVITEDGEYAQITESVTSNEYEAESNEVHYSDEDVVDMVNYSAWLFGRLSTYEGQYSDRIQLNADDEAYVISFRSPDENGSEYLLSVPADGERSISTVESYMPEHIDQAWRSEFGVADDSQIWIRIDTKAAVESLDYIMFAYYEKSSDGGFTYVTSLPQERDMSKEARYWAYVHSQVLLNMLADMTGNARLENFLSE